MNEIIEKAIGHITDQMMQQQNNRTIVAIEEHLTNICTTQAVANKLLAEGKNLKGAYNELMETARKRQVGGGGCIRSDEGFEIAEKYYGITEEDKQEPTANNTQEKAPVINIMDFM